MSITDYISKNYSNNPLWFEEEVQRGYHIGRIANCLEVKDYLSGQHKVLTRKDMEYKGETYKTRKIILQIAKTILNFHSTYLLGKPLSLSGDDEIIKEFNKIYRKGRYSNIDYKIIDKINKFGDAYEYVYIDEGVIKSKLINSEDAYPVYDDNGNYICFIEYYTTINSVSYYTVFYMDKVEQWTNEGGTLQKVNEYINVSGLPIHYHNMNDLDEQFGQSELKDIIPILDEMEDILSKMADSVYINSLSPMPVISGQRIESSIPSDAMGYILNLEDGAEFKYASATMDFNSIKLLYDNLKQHLLDIACMPSVAMGNSNVANVSEVSLKLLYQLADVKAMLNEKCVREGLYQRIDTILKLLKIGGVTLDGSIDVVFNYARPVNIGDIMDNLKTQYDMGAISKKTIIEKSEYTQDVSNELDRIQSEGVRGSNVEG
jgi:hypothetical protein